MKGYHTSLPFRSNDNLRPIHSAVRKLVTEESHEVGDYGLLHKAVTRQINQRRKKKKKQQSYSDCISHCHSLDKLQLLHQEKNDQIRRHIYEKAEYQAQNQELKQQISNPTMREHKLHLKIAQLEQQNRILKQQLERQKIAHRQELQLVKSHHKTQLELVQQTQKIATQQSQYRLQPTTSAESYRNSEPTSMNFTGSRSGNENRVYISNQNQTAINNKAETTSRMQVVASGTSQQQQLRTYVAGSPVYISANRQQEAKSPYMRSHSPDNSKNTTSQTQIYRGDSPKIITHTYGKPTGETNRLERIQISRANSNTRQEATFETVKRNQGIIVQRQNPTYIRTTLEARPAAGLSYAENDLQEIYKKYCIND